MIVKIKNNHYTNLDNLESFEIEFGIKEDMCGREVSSLPYFILEFIENHKTTNQYDKYNTEYNIYYYKYARETLPEYCERPLRELVIEELRKRFHKALTNKDAFFDFDLIVKDIIDNIDYQKFIEEGKGKPVAGCY